MPFNLWDLLTLQQPTTPKTPPPPYFFPRNSCSPTLFRPSARLRLDETTHLCIYGYLPRARQADNPGFLSLNNPPPAYVSYIMGSDWRDQLVPYESRDSTNPNYQYVPIPRDDDADEAWHCLRMRRCGALHVQDVHELAERQGSQDWPVQAAERQVFGWPAGGGVWVLRLPKRGGELGSLDEELAALEEEDHGELERVGAHLAKLREQASMEGICRVLEEAGAVFYSDPTECSEVREMGLLDPEEGSNDLVPPEGPGDEWQWREGV